MERDAQMSKNHITQYYLLQRRSVQFNMRVMEDLVNGDLEIAVKNYHMSRSQLMYCDYPAIHNFTPLEVKDLLEDGHFDDFTFTDIGFGCRYWK